MSKLLVIVLGILAAGCVAGLVATRWNGPTAEASNGAGPSSVASSVKAGVPATAAAESAATSTPAVAPVAVGPRKPTGPVKSMTIKELGHFEYDAEKGGTIPADVLAMDNATVRLRGYILPMSQAAELTDFALVPDLFNCCFGQPPGVQHVIMVRLPPKRGIDYTSEEVWVEGVLHVKEQRQDDYTTQIFALDGYSVKPAK